MVINSKDAKKFIGGYTTVLGQVHILTVGEKKDIDLLSMLASSRHKIVADPSLLEFAISTLIELGDDPDEEVVEALRSLQVKDWIYLRDTPQHSIFLSPDRSEAYAVLGLTDRISKITGVSGAVLQIGMVRYKGQYVCDGLVTNVAVLGPEYHKSFSEQFKMLKETGHFHL